MQDPDSILAGARTTVRFDPKDMVRELLAYGEAEAAKQIMQVSPKAIMAIGVLASRHYSAPDNPMLDTAICRAVVEFLEGKARPLRRKRRFYAKSSKAK
jgi:hypothetical protein